MARKLSERQIDAMANDGRLTRLAMQLAIDARADWPSLDGEAQDAWHERAIRQLRGEPEVTDYDRIRRIRQREALDLNRAAFDRARHGGAR